MADITLMDVSVCGYVECKSKMGYLYNCIYKKEVSIDDHNEAKSSSNFPCRFGPMAEGGIRQQMWLRLTLTKTTNHTRTNPQSGNKNEKRIIRKQGAWNKFRVWTLPF